MSLVQSCSSLKFYPMAEYETSIYPRLAPTWEWDMTVAQAVLKEADEAVANIQGMPLKYGKLDVLNSSFIVTTDTALIPA